MKYLKSVGFCLLLAVFTAACSGSSQLVVTARPSPPVVVRPVAPGPNYVWMDGEWIVRGRRYVWQPGHWVHRRHRVWVGGHWVRHGNGWYWRRGHWG